MTAKDLLQKFKSKNPNIQNDKLVTGIAAMLKKINPEKSQVKDKLFLFIKKTWMKEMLSLCLTITQNFYVLLSVRFTCEYLQTRMD